jgi:hypothetical protein
MRRSCLDLPGIRGETSKVGLPFIRFEAPLVAGLPSDPRHRDRIEFLPRAGAQKAVTLWSEPAWVPQGTGKRDSGDWAARSITNELNVTVEVQGRSDQAANIQREAERGASSMVPLD